MLHSLDIIGAGLFALLGASLIVGALTLWTRPQAARSPVQPEPAIFLFEGSHLVDASAAARRALKGQADRGHDLAKVLQLLARGFGTDLEERLAALPTGGRLSLASSTGVGTLDVTEEGGALRLTLRPMDAGASAIDRLSFDAALEELKMLRGLAEDAPNPIWVLGPSGELTWANRAYLDLSDLSSGLRDRAHPGRALWPTWPLFETPGDLAQGQVRQERRPLAPPDCEEPLWYDVTSVRRGGGSLHFAIDVTDLVEAEVARLHFVQTLAKTFANLSTGLAIFDRDRRLVVFNPAFLDLTGLPPDFLSSRPLVQAVLDRLRDARILPEPRDYVAWRESVAALEAAASQGEYCETWTLPSGRTYRVTGRPHPGGALAFLFEDISDEVGLARRLRTELDALREVLDSMDEAVGLLSPSGALALSNAAYEGLWGPPLRDASGEALAGEAIRWEAACLPSRVWTRFKGSPSTLPAPFQEQVRLRDGRRLTLRATPLAHGSLLVRFQADPEQYQPTAEVAESPHARTAEPA